MNACKNIRKKEKRKAKSKLKSKRSSYVPCRCKKPSKKKRRRNLRIHGTNRGPSLGPNPYLNYFRQFYAQRGGKVVEAAKEAGGNWRTMGPEEREKYRTTQKKKVHRGYYSRIKKLNKIFRLLTPKSKSATVKREQIVRVRKILERWTRHVYSEVSSAFNDNEGNESSVMEANGN